MESVRVESTEEYRKWVDGLRDVSGRARILMRVDRLVHGNAGDHRNLTSGVSELRIDVGPGYRVYFTKRANRLLLLLGGGNTATQKKDIARALFLAENFKE